MQYQHRTLDGRDIALPLGKVVCIGQNYQDHIAEMQSKTAPQALFFIKPATALCALTPGFSIPQQQGEVHNEIELAILIGKPLKQADFAAVNDAIWGYSLALDLTLRDVQAGLKQLGRPWEIAKGFDGACPVAGFVAKSQVQHPQQLEFRLSVNGQLRQNGNTANMIRGISQLIAEMSQHFTLLPGDIVLSGTPAGVGPLHSGDSLQLQLADLFSLTTRVY
ncbi:fumarylacetoacetate hydrolase family protein [Rheinheimera maricola]|uniref:Fumarylacetoacetate hydrolase family protein n=1 Tax=Rheinheimera maricola TaxID=2793282 RepID=A0ABS7XBA9_9GAMM|nr:fumarylacetoacetate hydrolase family protein [Rheinheimera maricola]MBZ9611897.1 fumarylacetoacetate hydrolase family protein [Rheinheimera maricola]